MIPSVLISGDLNDARLARAFDEIIEVCARKPKEGLVVVFDSKGGYGSAPVAFLECLLEDEPTRSMLDEAEVKIYEAHSAAALLAFSVGARRELAKGVRIGFHLPLLTLRFWDVDGDGRRIDARIVKQSQQYEVLLAKLMDRYGLSEPELKTELYTSGWLYLTADQCVQRGLVHELF